ncbi:hypothetical protein ACFQ14_09650 [Pseudahrensia aquimaris]|uniref:Uncharacterized protein n=1 Tax=Pseudahrensia aquimaris TaxID=744461 RepID=A0ABW3FID9_9HYPH
MGSITANLKSYSKLSVRLPKNQGTGQTTKISSLSLDFDIISSAIPFTVQFLMQDELARRPETEITYFTVGNRIQITLQEYVTEAEYTNLLLQLSNSEVSSIDVNFEGDDFPSFISPTDATNTSAVDNRLVSQIILRSN